MIWKFLICYNSTRVCVSGGGGGWSFHFVLSKSVLDIFHGIKVQNIVAGTFFTPILDLLTKRWVDEFEWTAEGCFEGFYYAYLTDMVQGVPTYLWHGWQTAKPDRLLIAVVKEVDKQNVFLGAGVYERTSSYLQSNNWSEFGRRKIQIHSFLDSWFCAECSVKMRVIETWMRTLLGIGTWLLTQDSRDLRLAEKGDQQSILNQFLDNLKVENDV